MRGYRCQPFYLVPEISDTIHSCVPKSQKSCCQGFPLFLLKLCAQVNKFCWSRCSICCKPSHIGAPSGGGPHWTHCNLMLTVGLAAKQRPNSFVVFTITITYCLVVRDAGFFRARVLALMPVHILPGISSHCALVQHHRGTIQICLQGSQENPPHVASRSP